MRACLVVGLTSILSLTAAAPAHAQRFWMQPSRYAVHPGQRVTFSLFAGDDVTRAPLRARALGRTVRFDRYSAAGVEHLLPRAQRVDGVRPWFVPTSSGWNLVVMERVTDPVRLDRAALTRLRDERVALPDPPTRPRRVVVHRVHQVLLRVGDARDEAWHQDIAAPLELTLLDDPLSEPAVGYWRCRFRLRESLPPDAVVAVDRFENGSRGGYGSLRNADGTHGIHGFARAGILTLHAAAVERAAPGTGVDYEVWYGSLSFSLCGPNALPETCGAPPATELYAPVVNPTPDPSATR
jgi:hypothetical protein